MKIYVDKYCSTFLPKKSYTLIKKTPLPNELAYLDSIPSDCDLVAITNFGNKLEAHQTIIDNLLPKTKKLIYLICETTNENLVDFLRANNNSKITFFIDAVLNCQLENVKSITSWFMCPDNLYCTVPPLQSLLNKIESSNNKPNYFDCLLGTGKDHRDQLARFYKNSSHKDKFVYTYFKNSCQSGIWNINLPSVVNHSSNKIDYFGYQLPLSAILPVEIYNQSYYSIVSETTTYNDYNQYTEKLAKPILAKRLFVAFAGQHYLRNLRKKGFLTFNYIIDESYDLIEDPDIRFYQAWQQVESLCSRDPAKLMPLLEPIVEYNKNHFLSYDWHKELKLTLRNALGHV